MVSEDAAQREIKTNKNPQKKNKTKLMLMLAPRHLGEVSVLHSMWAPYLVEWDTELWG